MYLQRMLYTIFNLNNDKPEKNNFETLVIDIIKTESTNT